MAADRAPEALAPSWWAPIASRVRPTGSEAAPSEEGSDAQALEVAAREPPDPVQIEVEAQDGASETGEEAVVDEADAVVEAIDEGPLGMARASVGTAGSEARSPLSVIDAARGDRPLVNAAATERGAYVQRVNERVMERFNRPLPIHLRDVQVRGAVTVRIVIQPGGRVDGVEVVKSSGDAWLDVFARDSIPPRLPRIPRELPQQPLVLDLVLNYR